MELFGCWEIGASGVGCLACRHIDYFNPKSYHILFVYFDVAGVAYIGQAIDCGQCFIFLGAGSTVSRDYIFHLYYSGQKQTVYWLSGLASLFIHLKQTCPFVNIANREGFCRFITFTVIGFQQNGVLQRAECTNITSLYKLYLQPIQLNMYNIIIFCFTSLCKNMMRS